MLYLPDFEIELFDLGTKDVSAQFDRMSLRLFLSIIQKIRVDIDELRPFFRGLLKELSEVETEAKKVEILEKLLHYLFSVREKDEQEFRNAEFYKFEGLRGAFMTILEELREEGIAKGKLEASEKMLAKGISLNDVLDITGLTEITLRECGIIK